MFENRFENDQSDPWITSTKTLSISFKQHDDNLKSKAILWRIQHVLLQFTYKSEAASKNRNLKADKI